MHGEDMQVAAAVLSKRYEEQLFSQASKHSKVVPVLVITGFLGSGKTTLVQHLLAASGQELKLGVLVNEVAALDVDGQLLSTSQSNAAAGIKAAQLAGGCACCSVSGDLQAALHELAGSSSYQQLDYLLLETSGVADVEPLASLLTSSGFKLAGVVAVVDAEAGSSQIQQEEVALAQLRAADVVVINKCDLASLSALSSVEDLVQDKAPGVRTLRARFGQVPPEALLDVDVEEATTTGDANAGNGLPNKAASVQGEIAFLSHEPVVSTAQLRGKARAGSLLSTQRAAKLAATSGAAAAAATDSQQQQQRRPHSHHHSHSSFVSVSFSSPQPLCMACFQAFVSESLLTATGLFRAKGFVWFEQKRSLQYVFHVSGKQRAECGATGKWQGPPGVQLVLIGQDQEVLVQLSQQLQGCLVTGCGCRVAQGQDLVQQATAAAAAGCGTGGTCANRLQQGQPVLQLQQQQQQQQRGAQHVHNVAADRFCQLVQDHHRFELWRQPSAAAIAAASIQHQQQQPVHNMQLQSHSQQQQQQQGGSAAAAAMPGLVEFTAMGAALHGVIADEVNATVLRKANATPGLRFLCHIKSPPALRTATASSQQVAYQGVLALQVCFRASDGAEVAEQQWQQFEAAVAPVLRKAYQHVHNCKCDVVQMMTTV